MPITILQENVTIKMTRDEALSLKRAIGNMSEKNWRDAGVLADDYIVAEHLHSALDDHFGAVA